MSDDLIRRQSAIDALKDMYHAAEKWGEKAADDVIKARAESCMASLIEMKLRIDKLPSAPQWIPCSERLPVENTEVLTYDSSFGITFDSLHRGKWRKHPVAWMPFPEPYKMGGEVQNDGCV